MTYLAVMLDPTAEATGTQLAINDGAPGHSGYVVHAPIDMPHPPLTGIYASSVDTEGALPAGLSYGNREVTMTVRCYGTTVSDVELKVGALLEKLGKFQREGGTMLITLPSTRTVTFDVCPESQGNCEFGVRFLLNLRADVEVKLTCRPFVRWAEQSLGNFTETTFPVLQAVVSGIDGDQLANGRAVITATAGDQWTIFTGVQSRFYDSSAHASLFYEAETRTPLGGAAIAAGASGASGAGSNVMRQGTLTTVAQAMMSTHSSAGTPLQHVGSFEVLARTYRPTTNTGAVNLFFEWGAGDFQTPTRNAAISFEADAFEAQWCLVSLGLVHIPKLTTQRWEGRIVASSTVAGDDLDIDWIGLCPTTAEGDPSSYGQWSGSLNVAVPTSFTARDEFDQTAGALTGKTLPVGGTWGGAGDADDFTVETAGHTAERTAVSDASFDQGRFVTAGSTNFTNAMVRVDFKFSAYATGQQSKVLVAYVDVNNWLAAYVSVGSSSSQSFVSFHGEIGGSQVGVPNDLAGVALKVDTWFTLQAMKRADGLLLAWVFEAGHAAGDPLIITASTLTATGGTLASALVGFSDSHAVATPCTRNYDNFAAWVPPADVACFATRTLTVNHKSARRQNSGGTADAQVSYRKGRYLRLAPGGAEGRSNRMFVKGVRGPEVQTNVWIDPNIDDIALDLFATPLGVAVPEP